MWVSVCTRARDVLFFSLCGQWTINISMMTKLQITYGCMELLKQTSSTWAHVSKFTQTMADLHVVSADCGFDTWQTDCYPQWTTQPSLSPTHRWSLKSIGEGPWPGHYTVTTGQGNRAPGNGGYHGHWHSVLCTQRYNLLTTFPHIIQSLYTPYL